MFLPDDARRFRDKVVDLVDICRVSAQRRAGEARTYKQWRFAGSESDAPALYNRLNSHINRLGAYLFSPSDLRFYLEYENIYGDNEQKMGDVAARKVTRTVEALNIDKKFQGGVDSSLTYGSAIFKVLWAARSAKAGSRGAVVGGEGEVASKVILPWNFGVYREDLNELEDQEVMCETSAITMSDLWRRVRGRSDAETLLKRARNYAKRRSNSQDADNYFHQILLASQQPVNVGPPSGPQSAGFVNVLGGPASAQISPSILADTVIFHELTVWNDDLDDWTTIQMAEPDIIVAPVLKRSNFFVRGELPYTLIQANPSESYLWGRSELADLIPLQDYLNSVMVDVKKLLGVQFDKFLAFIGFGEVTDEMYDAYRESGFISQAEGGTGKIEDLTPKLPQEAFEVIQTILKAMDDVGGFQNILSGQGEQGVRAGSHAQTLIRTASPPLRDRALSIERQCAEVGDKILKLKAMKNPELQWTGKGTDGVSVEFLLSQLPDDHRIVVDSHSSSPIYEMDHMQIAAFLAKLGAIDKESIIDLVNIPIKDLLKTRLAKMMENEQKMRKEILDRHPQLLFSAKGAKAA